MRLTLTPALRAFLESRLEAGAGAGAAGREEGPRREEEAEAVRAALRAGHVEWTLLKTLHAQACGVGVGSGGEEDAEGRGPETSASARGGVAEGAGGAGGEGGGSGSGGGGGDGGGDGGDGGGESGSGGGDGGGGGGGGGGKGGVCVGVGAPSPSSLSCAPGSVPSLRSLCRGSSLWHAPPPDRVSRQTPEFRATLARLRAELERKEYERMVRPAEAAERRAREAAEGGLSAYRRAGSLGVHIGLTMAGLFAFGWYAAGAVSARRDARLAGGLLGAVVALLVESTLFVIRTSATPVMHIEAAKHALRRKMEHQRAAQERAQRTVGGEGEREREREKERNGNQPSPTDARAPGAGSGSASAGASQSEAIPTEQRAPGASRARRRRGEGAGGSRRDAEPKTGARGAEGREQEGKEGGKKDK